MRQKIVTFGEIMLRMTRPEKLRIIQGSTWDGYFGGSEANVAVSLAMLGNDVEYVTRLPDNKLGQACLNELRKYNVGTRFVTRGGIRLGTYYYARLERSLRPCRLVNDHRCQRHNQLG